MANRLKELLKEQPELIRDYIDEFMKSKGDEAAWNTVTQFDGPNSNKPILPKKDEAQIWSRKPQYDQLPIDWKPQIFENGDLPEQPAQNNITNISLKAA